MINVGGRDCVKGIDVSKWQGNINFSQVKQSGVEFAFVKAAGADGGLYKDAFYQTNINGFQSVGIPVGAYFFMDPRYSGAQQANFFCDVLGNYNLSLPPVLDVETQGLTTAHVRDFISVLDQRIGKRWTGPTGKPVSAIIYTGASFAGIVRPFGDYDLWLAAYMNPNYPNPNPAGTIFTNLSLPTRYVPNPPWTNWSIWQAYGGDGRNPGVIGGVDSNLGTVEWFVRTTKGGTPQEEIDVTAEANILKRIDDLEGKISSWDNDTRTILSTLIDKEGFENGLRSRPYTFQFGTDNSQWVIAMTDEGLVRMHIPDPETRQALVDVGGINPDLVTVTDQTKIDRLKKIKEVPFSEGFTVGS